MKKLMLKIPALFLVLLPSDSCIAQTSSTESILYSVEQAPTGNHPTTGLIQASDGNFYGIMADMIGNGDGSVYRISPFGEYSMIYGFSGGSDGGQPLGSLIEGPDGALYGTTSVGGGWAQVGTVFRLTFDGQLTNLFDFTGPATGMNPQTALTLGSDGNLYGVVTQGGADYVGEVFRLSFSGDISVLYYFPFDVVAQDTPLGQYPDSPLLEFGPGLFVGSALAGGEYGGFYGDGTLYTIDRSGNYSVVHNFGSSATGEKVPFGPMAVASDGNLYGAANAGGPKSGGGVFRLSPEEIFTPWYDFDPFPQGAEPYGVILGSDGNIYGTNYSGGSGDVGTIFSLSISGNFNLLYSFPGYDTSKGSYPNAALPEASPIQGSDGAFYGTTSEGGIWDAGAIYRFALSPALPPPIELSLSSNQVSAGSSVTLNWIVHNGFTLGANQCYAFVQNNSAGAGNWAGRQTGAQTSKGYKGSAELVPTASGTFTYALTCGGVESGFATLTVTDGKKSSSSTSLSINPNATSQGQAMYLIANVAGSDTPTPTGTVTFSYSGGKFGHAVLANGTATFSASTSNVPAGDYLVTASYSGDSNYAPSTSAVSEATVYAYPTPTTAVLYQLDGPFPVNTGTNLYGIVAPTYGGPHPTSGTITFYFNGSVVSSGPVNDDGFFEGGVSFSGYPAGSYSAYSTYSGNSEYAPSKSAIQTVVLTTLPTATTFSIAPPSITIGDTATFKVQAAETTGSGIPTGTVLFTDSGVDLGSVTLKNGKADLTVPTKGYQAGTYHITATYSGDSFNSTSASTASVTLIQ